MLETEWDLKYRRVSLGAKDSYFEVYHGTRHIFQTIAHENATESDTLAEDEKYCQAIARKMSDIESAELD